jgi:hypothetical protein
MTGVPVLTTSGRADQSAARVSSTFAQQHLREVAEIAGPVRYEVRGRLGGVSVRTVMQLDEAETEQAVEQHLRATLGDLGPSGESDCGVLAGLDVGEDGVRGGGAEDRRRPDAGRQLQDPLRGRAGVVHQKPPGFRSER